MPRRERENKVSDGPFDKNVNFVSTVVSEKEFQHLSAVAQVYGLSLTDFALMALRAMSRPGARNLVKDEIEWAKRRKASQANNPRYKVIVFHGEMNSSWNIVDTHAIDDDRGPTVVATFRRAGLAADECARLNKNSGVEWKR